MQDKIVSIVFFLLLLIGGILGIFKKDIDISFLERRKLTTLTDLKDNYLDKMDDYLVDQFPYRDYFLKLNTLFERNILGNKEKNNVYVVEDYIYEKNYPLNEKSVNNFILKINYLKDHYFTNQNVFYTVIPDKSYFLDDNTYLRMDYNLLFNKLSNINIDYVDLVDKLSIDDYYYTDIHIKQDSWLKLLPFLSEQLGFQYQEYSYTKNCYYPFYGASYSKAMINNKVDELIYLTNEMTDDFSVKHLEYPSNSLYNKNKLGSIDSYDVFLDGASSFIEIINNRYLGDDELIIFRDSFASSLTPLLAPFYKKITLIDLRYINFKYVSDYIEIDNQDILFMYSTLIINNSNILKIDNFSS